jgi:nitrite reductase/ring-hydroxylating ferredoxin subunit
MEPVDGIAFAGHNPGDPAGSFIITGDSGTGMTNGTIGAKIVADAIRGERNRYADLFSPSRKSLRSTASYLKENLNAAGQYAEWLRIAPDDPERPLEPGEGRIEREHGAPIAVSCDRTGRISKCSAVCPHLGAILQWNSAEGTWDCPAHGSRFDGEGRILNGPANRPLRKKAPGVETDRISGPGAGIAVPPPSSERPRAPGAGEARP